MTVAILHGDCRDVLRTLPEGAFQCCVTSPPYYGLRDYGVAGQIGLEPTPDEYVADRLGRNATLIEINPEYRALAVDRLRDDAPLLADIA